MEQKSRVSTITEVRRRRRHRALFEAWKKSGLTQKEFARALRMGQQHFNTLLNLRQIPNPLGFTLEQQRALYRWTGMLPEELWIRPSQDFLDAAEARGKMVRLNPRQADQEIDTFAPTPEDALGRQACARAVLGKLKPYSQRVIQQLLITGEPSEALGDGLLLSRQRISQIAREKLEYLRGLVRRNLLPCCAA